MGVQGNTTEYLIMNDNSEPTKFFEKQTVDARMINTRGTMIADFDKDGWLDLVARPNGANQVFAWRNNSPSGAGNINNWVQLQLTGDPTSAHPVTGLASSRDALGARIEVYPTFAGDCDIPAVDPLQLREVISGNSNAASTSDLTVHFGLGSITNVCATITWPSGRVNRLRFYPQGPAPVSARYSLTENAADDDFDLVPNVFDNCPIDANGGQRDTDLDGIGDVCESGGGGGGPCTSCLECLEVCEFAGSTIGPGPDFDQNGLIDATDLWIMMMAQGYKGGKADLNADGFVNIADIAILYSQLGPKTTPAPNGK